MEDKRPLMEVEEHEQGQGGEVQSVNPPPQVTITSLYPAMEIDPIYHPLLDYIAKSHPETFAGFRPESQLAGRNSLMALHDSLSPFWGVPARDFTLMMGKELDEIVQDFSSRGFDLSWLPQRAFKIAKNASMICQLRERIRATRFLVESSSADRWQKMVQHMKEGLAASNVALAALEEEGSGRIYDTH